MSSLDERKPDFYMAGAGESPVYNVVRKCFVIKAINSYYKEESTPQTVLFVEVSPYLPIFDYTAGGKKQIGNCQYLVIFPRHIGVKLILKPDFPIMIHVYGIRDAAALTLNSLHLPSYIDGISPEGLRDKTIFIPSPPTEIFETKEEAEKSAAESREMYSQPWPEPVETVESSDLPMAKFLRHITEKKRLEQEDD